MTVGNADIMDPLGFPLFTDGGPHKRQQKLTPSLNRFHFLSLNEFYVFLALLAACEHQREGPGAVCMKYAGSARAR